MAFYLRKSISVGRFRFNLSKSGVGLSVGVRGLRVGTGPRGHYIHAGASGFYYRASIGRAGDRTPPSSASPHQTAVSFVDNVAIEEIESGDVLAMTDVRFQDLISEINRKCKQLRLSSILGWSVGGIGAWISLAITNPVPLLAVLPAYALGKWLDDHRRTTVLFYDLEPPVLAAYRDLIAAFERMSGSAKSWHVSAHGRVLDVHTWKRNAGADKLIKTTVISPKLALPAEVRSNLDPPHLNVGRQDLYFFPDFVLTVENGRAGAISYSQLGLDARGVLHIEHGAVPADAQVVDHTWQHPNKKGGPDRRFSFNRRLPICCYEALHLTSISGLNELVTFSRKGCADTFSNAAKSLAKFEGHQASVATLMPADALSPTRSFGRTWRKAAAVVIGLGIAGVAALVAHGPSPSPAPVVAKVERPVLAPRPIVSIPAKNTRPGGPSTAVPIDVAVALTIQPGNMPVVLGRTNLPSGTRLVITLSQNQTVIAVTASVGDGHFRAGPFTLNGLPLSGGLYRVDVQSAPASQQPWPTRGTFGTNGHNLRGPNTRLVSDERRVSISQPLTIGTTPPPSPKSGNSKLTKPVDACKSGCTAKRRKAKERDGVLDLNACYAKCVTALSKRKKSPP